MLLFHQNVLTNMIQVYKKGYYVTLKTSLCKSTGGRQVQAGSWWKPIYLFSWNHSQSTGRKVEKLKSFPNNVFDFYHQSELKGLADKTQYLIDKGNEQYMIICLALSNILSIFFPRNMTFC